MSYHYSPSAVSACYSKQWIGTYLALCQEKIFAEKAPCEKDTVTLEPKTSRLEDKCITHYPKVSQNVTFFKLFKVI